MMMQNFACNCLNVRIRAAPTNSINPDELNSALRAIEQNNCPELAEFVQISRLVKIGHEPIQIRHPFLCAHRLIGNGSWSLCICAACDLITHAVRISDNTMELNVHGGNQAKNYEFFVEENIGVDCIGGLVLVNSALLNDDQAIDSLRSSSNFSPVFDIIVPLAQLAPFASLTVQGPTFSGNATFPPNQHDSSGRDCLGSVSSVDWTPPSSLATHELVNQIVDNVRAYLKREQEAKDERIRGFVLEQERAFDALCQSAQMSRINFVHLVESLRKRHTSAENDKENRNRKSDNKQAEMFGSDIKDYGHRVVGSNRAMVSIMASTKEHENYFTTMKIQQQQQASSQSLKKKQAQSKCFVRSDDYEDCDLFQMDDIDAERPEVVDIDTLQEEQEEDELPDVENDSMNFANLSQPINNNELKQFLVNTAGNRIRKVSNVQNVPFSYRDNRVISKPFGGISLPIPIPVHLQNARSETEEDASSIDESGDIADRMLKMTRSVRNSENFELEDRPRRRLNTCDLIDSNRLRAFMYE